MTRQGRADEIGAWHHVMNRGIARRPLFEDRRDVRYFLSCLAREVRRGRLEVHSYCVMTTHFHVRIRSPAGLLSEGLRRAQNDYVRFFNRRHQRDGTLVRGRFKSRRVRSLEYRRILVRYIDANPVVGGLVLLPWDYAYGSAANYVHRSGPPWLTRSWVESEVANSLSGPTFSPGGYQSVFGPRNPAGDQALVESRLKSNFGGVDDLDDLVGSAPDSVRSWLKRKAQLADGHAIGLPVCDCITVMHACESFERIAPPGASNRANQPRPAEMARIGLLRALAAAKWRDVARIVDRPMASCQRLFAIHQRLLRDDATYAAWVARIAQAALEMAHNPRSTSWHAAGGKVSKLRSG